MDFSVCSAVYEAETGAGQRKHLQLQGSDLQQHQGAGQTLLTHLRMGPDQIPRVPGHDPQVAQSTPLLTPCQQVHITCLA